MRDGDRKTRVLFLQSQEYFGADSLIHSLIARELDRSRFEVYVACQPGRRGAPSPSLVQFRSIPGVQVRPTHFGPSLHHAPRAEQLARLATAMPGGVLDVAALVRFVARERIDVVHGTEKPRDVLTGLLIARLTRAKFVVHLHVKFHERLKRHIRWAMRLSDLLVGVSAYVSETARENGVRRVRTVLNALDVDRWERPAEDPAAVREELGLPPGALVSVISARLFWWKGHDLLLRAAARVADAFPEHHIPVAGEDEPRAHPGGGSFTAELRATARELGIERNVHFLGFRSDVKRIVAAADLYAMPSFEEPFGLVYLEAMALEKPVLGLDNGGTPEVVTHGETGLLSPQGNVEALASNYRTLLGDAALRRRMGASGRARLEAHFRPERLGADMGEVYLELLRRPASGRARLGAGAAASDG